MGIIINQSIKNMVTTYLGFAIGAVNTLFLFTYFLTKEYYGLVSFLLSAANLIWPFLVFGVHSTLIKFFTSYKTRKEQDRLLTLMLILPALAALLLGLVGLIFYSELLEYFKGENELVQPYIWLIFLIAFATAYFEVFFAWSKIYYKSSFGNFMKEVFHRFCISVLLLMVYKNWISVSAFIYAISGVFVFRMIVMALYAFSLHPPRISLQAPENLSRLLKYSALILIAASVATVLLDLDKVMIEYYMPIENVAIYGIAVYIATVISVPQKAMHQITHPMTAEMLNTKDKSGLKNLYQKSSLNLLIISALIFIWIITNVEALYELIPQQYQISVFVVILISIVKLYDNLLGNNNSILFNSDYYRIVLGIGVILVLLAFILNYLLIPKFGLEGAAIASFLAFFIYNTSKIFLVYIKFRIQPFSKSTWLMLLLTLVLTAGFYYIDISTLPILNICLKVLISGIIYGLIIYFSKVSSEINKMIDKVLKLS